MARVIFGNLLVEESGETVRLQLNTFHKGQPFALFGREQLHALGKYLMDLGGKQAVAAARLVEPVPEPVEEEPNWEDLI